MSDDPKTPPVKVWLVNPPIQDPWRTHDDYLNEQKRSRRLYVVAFVSIIVSALAAVGTAVGAGVTLRSYTHAAPQTVKMECVAPSNAGGAGR